MRAVLFVVMSMLLLPFAASAQRQAGVTVTVRIVPRAESDRSARAVVVWLDPIDGHLPFPPQSHTLLQKNRTFTPHIQVVPVGSDVQFPNADPFFHNVFSLYQGKRFDLGLYEAGSSKSVKFGRPGVSYIFCNIHPEMSAVIIALQTPLYVISGLKGNSSIGPVPPGDYMLHVWAEGLPQASLDSLGRRIHVGNTAVDLGTLTLPPAEPAPPAHLNKFGKPYERPLENHY